MIKRLLIFSGLFWATQALALVPFFSDPTYERDEPIDPPWFVMNSGQPSRLYHNGVYQSQETGTDDLDLLEVWSVQSSGVPVGLMDMTGHGVRTRDLVATVAPESPQYYKELSRWDVRDIADGINQAILAGCRVVVIGEGFSTQNAALYAACGNADAQGVLICCAVPNSEINLDSGACDYPYSWAGEIGAIIGVNCTGRTGAHYAPSAAGVPVLGAPGRNIVAAGTYSSGTSWATAIFAGCASLLMERYSGQTPAAYRNLLETTARAGSRRIDMLAAFQLPRPRLAIRPGVLIVYGLSDWRYVVERSGDLTTWSWLAEVNGGDELPVTPGFFRASANVGWRERIPLTKHKK
jgi:hypothetical protein